MSRIVCNPVIEPTPLATICSKHFESLGYSVSSAVDFLNSEYRPGDSIVRLILVPHPASWLHGKVNRNLVRELKEQQHGRIRFISPAMPRLDSILPDPQFHDERATAIRHQTCRGLLLLAHHVRHQLDHVIEDKNPDPMKWRQGQTRTDLASLLVAADLIWGVPDLFDWMCSMTGASVSTRNKCAPVIKKWVEEQFRIV